MGDRYEDVTIRDYGAAGTPSGRIKPLEAHHLKKGKTIIDPNSGQPCVVADQPKKSKTGKHGHAKLTSKLSNLFNHKTAQIMAPGGKLLEEVVVEKVEYCFSYISEGDFEEDELVVISVLDSQDQEVELKLSKKREDVWKKVKNIITEGEEKEKDIFIMTQEAPYPNKSVKEGYEIYQLVIDAKLASA